MVMSRKHLGFTIFWKAKREREREIAVKKKKKKKNKVSEWTVECKTLIPLSNFKLLYFRAASDKTATVSRHTCH